MAKILEKLRDVLIGVGIVGVLFTGFWFWGPPWWAWFLLSLGGFVGVWEVILRWKTGKTLSQHFWAWNKDNKTLKWVFAGILFVLFGVGLVIHLLWKG